MQSRRDHLAEEINIRWYGFRTATRRGCRVLGEDGVWRDAPHPGDPDPNTPLTPVTDIRTKRKAIAPKPVASDGTPQRAPPKN